MRKQRWVWFLLLGLYICFLFSNSLTPAVQSSAASGRVLLLIHALLSEAGVKAMWLTEHVLRKLAHFAEYTVLGLLLAKNVSLISGSVLSGVRLLLPAGIWIPFVDETLQLFTEGRSGQISDVWLDMSGVLAGTLCYLFFSCLLRRGKRKTENGVEV